MVNPRAATLKKTVKKKVIKCYLKNTYKKQK